jgi:hypothetical protein
MVITPSEQFYNMQGLVTCGKHLYDRIISLIGEVLTFKTNLTLPLSIDVSVPSKESELP